MNKNIKYKPSMFNFIMENSSKELILYNSYNGLNSIRKVQEENKKKIKEWLSSDSIEYIDDINFKKLYEYGYIIPENINEKIMRDTLYMNNRYKNDLILVVHTTETCNFRCVYCASDFEGGRKITFSTQQGIINFIQKNISRYKHIHISWFGGEPLLEVDAIENISKKVIEICNRAKRTYSSAMTTNGYYLNADMVKKLFRMKVSSYVITIDTLKENHDKLRVLKGGQPTFDKIISNLLDIKQNVKTIGINIIIRSNLTKDMLPKIEEYYKFYDDTFGEDERFSLFIRKVGNWGGTTINQISSKLFNNNDDFREIYDTLSKIKNRIFFKTNFKDMDIGGMTCQAQFLNKFTISVDGIISKCDDACTSVDDKLAIGKLNSNGEMELDLYKNACWSYRKPLTDSKCDNCFYSCACFGECCIKKKLYSNDFDCSLNMNDFKGMLELISTKESVLSI